jgi:hypothetical protein
MSRGAPFPKLLKRVNINLKKDFFPDSDLQNLLARLGGGGVNNSKKR